MKKLYRSQQSKMVSGVLGGLAKYFNMDVTILRLMFVFSVLITGVFPLVILYIVAVIIIPQSPTIRGGKTVIDQE